MKKIDYATANEIIVSDKEFDGCSDWNDRFTEWLKAKGLPVNDWDEADLGWFFRDNGYRTV